MKTRVDYQRQLIEAVRAGDLDRARDLKAVIKGKAMEVECFTDFIKAATSGMQIVGNKIGPFSEFLKRYGRDQKQ